jgi:signal transduction histidine kinase
MENFFKRLPTNTLRGKFLSFNLPIMILALCIVALVFATFDYRSELENFEMHLDYLIDTNKSNLAQAIDTDHKEWQKAILQNITNDPSVKSVIIFDKNNNLIYEFHAPQNDPVYYLSERSTQLFHNNIFIGNMKLIASSKHNFKSVRNRLLIDLYLSIFAVLVVTLSALIINRYTIDNPLVKLLDAIQLTKTSKINQTVDWQSNDEIGSLVKAFNEMQLQIQEQTQSLTATKEEAVAANKAKTEFVANISHELRTPMHAIIGLTNLCIKKSGKWPPEQFIQCLSEIKSSSERLLILLNELLDIAKLESGKMHYDAKQNNLLSVTQWVINELFPLINEKNIQISLQAEHPEDLNGYFDYFKIGQVIRNLLSNSIKFSPTAGKITITLLAEAGNLKLSISDHGIGIPAGEINSIFEKFVQSSKTKTGAGGTGLGLSICKDIILAHHGSIIALNNRDQGATFTFSIPKEHKSK